MRLINDTMMTHPMHIHGHFWQIVNGHGSHQPLKHTVRVLPGGYIDLDMTADAPGDWAFHCHLLYHMHAGHDAGRQRPAAGRRAGMKRLISSSPRRRSRPRRRLPSTRGMTHAGHQAPARPAAGQERGNGPKECRCQEGVDEEGDGEEDFEARRAPARSSREEAAKSSPKPPPTRMRRTRSAEPAEHARWHAPRAY